MYISGNTDVQQLSWLIETTYLIVLVLTLPVKGNN